VAPDTAFQVSATCALPGTAARPVGVEGTAPGTTCRNALARLAVEETGRGVFEDKAVKNIFACEHVAHSMATLRTVGVISEDDISGITEIADPVGVIAGITPTTNPTSTAIFKALLALKTRNPIVFAFHPAAQRCSVAAARVVRDAAIAAGAPENCIQWIEHPSVEATTALMHHSGIATILATGGNNMVKAAYSAGKPALGVGAGNVPAWIEASAKLPRAVNDYGLTTIQTAGIPLLVFTINSPNKTWDQNFLSNYVVINVKDATLGDKTQASVQVLNLLGEKYLELTPKGSGKMEGGDTVPVSRTNGSYDIVATLGELTTTTEAIDIPRLSQALTTLGDTVNAASPHIRSTFTGLSRVSQSIASRDEGIEQLVRRADRVTKLLAERRGDLVALMKEGDLVFQELIKRRDAINSLLHNATRLAVTLRGIATDNQGQIHSALQELSVTLKFLQARKKQLDATMKNLGPYASILINIIGTGPWFDTYVPNLVGLASGEFAPGKRKG